MKTHREKVMAAIAGAITMYLEAERQLQMAAEAPREESVQPQTIMIPATTTSSWVIAGRHAAMEMRRMLQMRMLR